MCMCVLVSKPDPPSAALGVIIRSPAKGARLPRAGDHNYTQCCGKRIWFETMCVCVCVREREGRYNYGIYIYTANDVLDPHLSL